MKNKRREFLKMTGMAGIGLAGARILPDFTSGPSTVQEEQIDPAPEWVQNADMFTSSGWYVTSDRPDTQNPVWKGYDIELKDVSIERIVRLSSGNGFKKKTEQVLEVKDGTFDGSSINGVSLISHVPISKTAFQQAHEQGFRVIPYVHFTDIHSFYTDQDVFLFQHPEVLLKDENGVLVLNDNSQNITKEISLPKEFKHKQVFDLYEGKKPIKVTKGKIKVSVPKQSARVYIITG